MVAAGEHTPRCREELRLRLVVDHPVSHAVVYISFVGLCMLHTGLALGILGRRAGGVVGARMTDAGNSVSYISLLTLLLWPVAILLFGLRAAVAGMESDEAPAPKPPTQSREIFWAVLKDFKLAWGILFIYGIGIAGLWLQRSTSGKGCFAEEFGSLVFDTSVIIIAVIHMFVVLPRWIHEWRTGRKS